MKSGRRLWRDADGGLVEEGHASAVTLAYGEDDELTPADVKRLKPEASESAEPKEEPKADRPATKATAQPPNKGRGFRTANVKDDR